MPHFLTQVAYNEQAWQSLVSNPQNRLDAIRPVVEKLGGRVVNAYFAFGDYDFVLITELPDNATAAADRCRSFLELRQSTWGMNSDLWMRS